LLIEKLSDGSRYSPIGLVSALRAELIQEFHAMFSTQTAGVMIASMLGNKYFLDKRQRTFFREGEHVSRPGHFGIAHNVHRGLDTGDCSDVYQASLDASGVAVSLLWPLRDRGRRRTACDPCMRDVTI
jgi:hypothetical protein